MEMNNWLNKKYINFAGSKNQYLVREFNLYPQN